MPLTIPVSNVGRNSFSTFLAGETYIFETYWNNQVSMWYLNLFTATNEPLLEGIALVPNINLLRQFPSFDDFGEFRVLDLTGEGNATIDSLGNTALLLYYEPGEFESMYPDYDDPVPQPLTYNFYTLLFPVTVP
jgi:hypothetical protein